MLVVLSLIGVIVFGLLFYMNQIEPKKLIVRHVELTGNVTKEATIAHLSDTHFKGHHIEAQAKKIIENLNDILPDYLLFTGDLIDCFEASPWLKDMLPPYLRQMKARYGKIAVYGNHDIGGGAKHVYRSIMEEGGFQVLCNEVIGCLEFGISFFGVDDPCAGYEDQELVKQQLSPYQVLLCHEPDFVDQIDTTYLDLMVSGHTHGGQIYLPLLSKVILPKGGKRYRKGLYQIQDMKLYVSSGIGTTWLPFRFRNVPEIIVYHIRPNK